MSNNSSDRSDSNPADEQGGKTDKTTEPANSGSTIDEFLGDDESNVYKDSKENDPDRYDLPHPLAREWIAKRHGLRWSDKTVETYQSQIRIYLAYLDEKGIRLVNAEFGDLIEFIEYRVQVGAAQSTVINQCAALKDLYRYIKIRTDSELAVEPYMFDEVNLNEYNYEGGFERVNIEPDEVYRLFQSFKRPRDRLMAYFAVATGVRNSDICELKLDNVHYDELDIYIPNPKGGNPYSIPMTRELASKLKLWERTGREGYATAEASPYMFPTQRSDKIQHARYFNGLIVEAAERAGIQEVIGTKTVLDSQDLRNEQQQEIHRVTVHTLRHTCLTMLKKAGAPSEARRKMANHMDIETTKNYTHDDDEEEDWKDLIRDLLDF